MQVLEVSQLLSSPLILKHALLLIDVGLQLLTHHQLALSVRFLSCLIHHLLHLGISEHLIPFTLLFHSNDAFSLVMVLEFLFKGYTVVLHLQLLHAFLHLPVMLVILNLLFYNCSPFINVAFSISWIVSLVVVRKLVNFLLFFLHSALHAKCMHL